MFFRAGNAAQVGGPEKNISGDKKMIVVYYSRSGNTKLVAELIAQKTNAELRRIEEVSKRRFLPTTLFFGGYQAVTGKSSKLKPMDYSLEGYDLVFLGTPVWASSPTPAMNAFVSQAEFSGKKVILFFTMGGDKFDKAAEILKRKIEGKGGTVKGAFGVQTSGVSGMKKEEEKKLLEGAAMELDRLLK